ncbi:hypothetical protein HMPREF1508_1912 [Shuttleworthella sp. MSX8B]|uniref:Uncharacterized protein n=1 Tax=Shuttleworthella satelles DSM 14600 TaxID=626523 RepID=C4G9C2_9FIRM|nr:hypothetical protein GCWU000342_00574 [Shuttleworthia satelles DSM 14600]EUB12779.1 hypothetical protein HMPREF1508_1912 [Shuttleworthia sp. MSX8B]
MDERRKGAVPRETAGGSFFLTSITDEFLGQTLRIFFVGNFLKMKTSN